MNVIMVMSDTFRYDNLSCYVPNTIVRTPRLDRFAKESHVFTNAYLGSFPTLPNRLDIMSGRFSFIDHVWCPLPKDTITLQQILGASGFRTQLICDNPHMIEMGFNYERGFDGWEWIRGQETDHWKSLPRNVKLPDGGSEKNRRHWILESYARNTAWWRGEEDRFAARSVKQACDWLTEAARDTGSFFLHLDLFDPHEPWDPPQHYIDLYDPDYQGEKIILPHYEFWRDFLSEAELNHIRARYMAETTMVDRWIGVLLDKIEELGLTEDTAVIFTSDHGYLFGEHGLTGKSRLPEVDGRMYYESIPMYNEIRRIPLMIRLPESPAGQRIDALVQSPDLMSTILELAGLVATEAVGGDIKTQALQCGVFYTSKWKYDPALSHGKSLMPLMRGETSKLRDLAVSSCTLTETNSIVAKSAIITEDGWCLHYAGKYPDADKVRVTSAAKLLDPAMSRIDPAPALYYLPDDPGESNNIIGLNHGLAQEIHAEHVRWLEQLGTPEEYLAGRRELE